MKNPKNKKKRSYTFNTAMLIDDSEIDNFINQKIIESNFFAEKIYVATSGLSALELLKNLAVNDNLLDTLIPEVIFTDLNMPLMDGFQFLNQFVELPEKITKKSKLVILTSSFNPKDKERALGLFKNIVFLNKPLTDESLALLS
jgi:CheY-like chemotaxis protein